MAYKDSDYTVVIAMMQWHKIKIIVLKLTLVVEIWTLLSRRWPPLLERSPTSGSNTALRKGTRRFCPHGRDRCRSLTLTCRNSPCWLSCECCNNVLSSFWSPLLAIDWAWLPRGMCVNWNELLALRKRGYEWYLRHDSTLYNFWSSLYISIMVLMSCVIIGTNCHT